MDDLKLLHDGEIDTCIRVMERELDDHISNAFRENVASILGSLRGEIFPPFPYPAFIIYVLFVAMIFCIVLWL